MSNSASLEDKFQAAVKAIQRLPNDGESSREIKFLNNSFVFFIVVGTFQPSNELKLTFYGLYKQATVGPCNEPRPSIFNYVNRAKWYFSKIEISFFYEE